MNVKKKSFLVFLSTFFCPDVAGLRFDQVKHTYEDLLVTISPDITPDVTEQNKIIGKLYNSYLLVIISHDITPDVTELNKINGKLHNICIVTYWLPSHLISHLM